ncbi:NADP-dependent oxidoreductase [Novosphingobium colocasiae]|uniref:NADP-dependent oxidoreductase n=1 Tax=Novosphingobium colocasiae TaxID=1256513 RepID=UPI0035AE5D3F
MVMDRYGGPEVLRLADLPMPTPAAGQAIVAVKAAAINPADCKWRSGRFADSFPVSFPDVLGYDIAGVVVEAPDIAPGTRVAAMLGLLTKGGYAEYVAVDADQLAVIPDSLSFEAAAAVPAAGVTGMQMIERCMHIEPGQLMLITGAVGAVGRFAMHTALARGAQVVAAVRKTQIDEALARGAAQVLVLGEDDWDGPLFDHVADTLGGPQVTALCRHVAANGTIVTVSNEPIEPEGLPVPPRHFIMEPSGPDLARLLDAVATGAIEAPIARILPLEEAGAGQRMSEAGGLGGKIILKV